MRSNTVQNMAALRRYANPVLEPFMSAKNEPAFVLMSWPWKETSLICELLTAHYGRVTVTVRGAKRKGSRFRGIVAPFCALEVSFSGRGEMKNMTEAKWFGSLMPANAENFLTAFYLNELLVRMSAKETDLNRLFYSYQRTLEAIAKNEKSLMNRRLREFEVDLLRTNGWGQAYDETLEGDCVVCDGVLKRVDSRDVSMGETIFSKEIVRAVLCRDFDDDLVTARAKLLLREIMSAYLSRDLGTRRTLSEWRQF